jgi:hypothetical protein
VTGAALSRLGQPPLTWRHQDTDLNGQIRQALDSQSYFGKGDDGAPFTPRGLTRMVRALAVATLYTVENSRTVGVPKVGEMETALQLGADLHPADFPTREHCFVASTLARTLQVYGIPGPHKVSYCETKDGEPAVLKADGPSRTIAASGDTGFPQLLVGVVVVTAIVAAAVAACWWAQADAKVHDAKLNQDALTARMMETQARAVGMVSDHLGREQAVGHPIPWDPNEQKVLDSLLATQRAIADRAHTPLPMPFDGALESIGDKAKKTASTLLDLGLIAGGMLIVGGMLKGQERAKEERAS